MIVYIVQLDNIHEISERTVEAFMVITDDDIVRVLSEKEPCSRRALYDILNEKQKEEIDLYMNIMMNQHFKKNRDYLLLSSRQSLSHLQLVHHITQIREITKHLLQF